MNQLLDSKQIGVFLDERSKLASPSLMESVQIYCRYPGDVQSPPEWKPYKKITCPPNTGNSLHEFRGWLRATMNELGACRILIGGINSGIAYSVLDEWGYTVCEMDTFSEKALETVRTRVMSAWDDWKPGASRDNPSILPKEVSPGEFFIDIRKAKAENPGYKSRESLLTFFESTPFVRLHLRCGHPPRWLKSFATVTKLQMETFLIANDEVEVAISHRLGQEPGELQGQCWTMPGSCSG